jgi:2-phospho-L-lactate guanylyltransferase
LPIDLPLLTCNFLRSIVAESGDVIIAPDKSERGTNLLLLRQDAVVATTFRFGSDSFPAHLQAATDASFMTNVIQDDCVSFDLDLPEHLWQWLPDLRQKLNIVDFELRESLSKSGE